MKNIKEITKQIVIFLITGVSGIILESLIARIFELSLTTKIITAVVFIVLLAVIFFICQSPSAQQFALKKALRRIDAQFKEHIKNKGYNDAFYKDIVFPKIEAKKREYGDINEMLDSEQYMEIIAIGGAGKTTLLQYVVYSCISGGTKKALKGHKIPFYVALNKIVNYKGDYFISETICKDYFDAEDEGEKAQQALIKYIVKNKKLQFILLFDGFNELRDDNDRDRIMAEVSAFYEIPNVKIILTSRSDVTDRKDKLQFTKVTIHGFSEEAVRELLASIGLPEPNRTLFGIIQNPLMFSIYRQLSGNKENLDTVTNEGKLLQSYFALQEKSVIGNASTLHSTLIYNFVIPYIGYSLETNGLFDVSGQTLRTYINGSVDFLHSIFTESNMDVLQDILAIDNHKFNGAAALVKKIEAGDIEDIIVENMAVIVKSGTENRSPAYSFYHQNFRDYFSALHIYNQTRLLLDCSDIFKRVIPYPIAVYFCQMYGEDTAAPEYGRFPENSGRYIHGIIERVSEIKNDTPGYYLAIRNLFYFMEIVHGGLYGYDYCNLDLSKFALNGVLLSQNTEEGIKSSDFTNCTIDYLRFLPQGHLQWVYSVAEIDNDTIVSCGRDGNIKLWNIPLSYCEYTLNFSGKEITHIIYANGFIYAAASDGAALQIRITGDRRLRLESSRGLCNCPISGISQGNGGILFFAKNGKIFLARGNVSESEEIADIGENIVAAKYSSSFGTVYICTENGELKELDTETGRLGGSIVSGHKISGLDINTKMHDKQLLLVSDDLLVFNRDSFSLQTQKAKRLVYSGSSPRKAIYCDNFQKAVAVYNDNSVVLWNLSRETYDLLYSHNDLIDDITVIPDANIIVTSSRDFSIKIYSTKSGEVIDCFKGESYWIRKIVCVGNKLLIPCTDGSIKQFDLSTYKFDGFLFENDIRAYSACMVNDVYLVSSLINGRLVLWDMEKHAVIDQKATEDTCMDDVESIGNGLFVSVNSENKVFLWSADGGKINRLCENGAFCTGEQIPGTAVNSIYHFKGHNGSDIIVSLHWTNKIGIWTVVGNKLELCSQITNAVNASVPSANIDWPYCAAELDAGKNKKLLLITSRKGYVNVFSVINGKNETGIYAAENYLAGHPVSLYSAVTFGEFIVLSDATGGILIYRGKEEIYRKKLHRSRIFLLKKTDERHFITYSEDGEIKHFEFSPEEPLLCGTLELVPGLFVKNCFWPANSNEERNTETKKLFNIYK